MAIARHTPADNTRRYPHGERASRYRSGDDSPSADNCVVPDFHAFGNDDARPEPHIVPNCDGTRDVPLVPIRHVMRRGHMVAVPNRNHFRNQAIRADSDRLLRSHGAVMPEDRSGPDEQFAFAFDGQVSIEHTSFLESEDRPWTHDDRKTPSNIAAAAEVRVRPSYPGPQKRELSPAPGECPRQETDHAGAFAEASASANSFVRRDQSYSAVRRLIVRGDREATDATASENASRRDDLELPRERPRTETRSSESRRLHVRSRDTQSS